MNLFAKALIFIATVYCLIGCSKTDTFEQVNVATLPQLDYCELRNQSDRYDGKIVKISAHIGNFGHGYYFDDERCSEKIYSDLLDDNRTSVKFFEPKAAELTDVMKNMGFVCCYTKPTNVLAVGRFTRQYPSSFGDPMEYRTSFHFELFSVQPMLNAIDDARE